MTQYNKSTQEYFPDFCDQVIYSGVGPNELQRTNYPKIVNHPIIWVNQLSGFKNPGWKALVRQGNSATTHLIASENRFNKASYIDASVRTSNVSGVPGNYNCCEWKKGYPHYATPQISNPTAALLSEVRNIALAKFISRANMVVAGSMSGETLGEWKQTVRAVTNPLGALRSFVTGSVKSAKKRMRRFYENSHGGRLRRSYQTPSGRRAAAEALAGTYLEFVFGWIPLVKSVNEATKALLDRAYRPQAEIVSGLSSREYNGVQEERGIFTYDYIYVYQNLNSYSKVEHKYKASISTGVIDDTRSISASLGLLPEFWVPTIWELIPYSFVIDYFVNIGDIVAAASFRRSRIRWGTSTTRVTSEFNYSQALWRNVQPVPNYYGLVKRLDRADVRGGDAQAWAKSVERQDIHSVSLMPDLVFHLPYSNKSWVNMAAVLTANFCRVW